MELKTKIIAEAGQQDILITRTFDLPLELLFKAYEVPEIIEQWMGTKVLKLVNEKHGGWQFETTDARGKVVFRAHGVIHSFNPDKLIIRTFEMENANFGVQLEFLEFEKLSVDTSKLTMHTVYQSTVQRDQMLALPLAKGLNMAHNRLQEIVKKFK